MKKIQNFYLYSYRMLGFVFLIGLISSILWYGFSMLFFMGSSSWAVPIILSSNQENVINHLEHVLVIEQNAKKDIAELKVLEKNLTSKKKLLKLTNELHRRVMKTMISQSNQYQKNSHILKELSKEKTITVSQLKMLASKIKNDEATIDQELKFGLITQEEALAAHLVSNKIRSDLVDAKATLHELEHRSQDFSNAANTLNGASNDMEAIYKVVKKVELETQLAELKSDIFSLNINIDHLKKSIQKKSQALSVIKNSPYIHAIKEPTTVAFVPYHNLKRVHVGSAVYSCYLDMIFCYQSGLVSHVYEAEEYFSHPIFKSEVKGRLIGITFNHQTDSQKKLLFLNSKPLIV